MNKLTRMILGLMVFLSTSGFTPVTSSSRLAQVDDPEPDPNAPEAAIQAYLPILLNHPGYTVRGRVIDELGRPIAGVTITSETGSVAMTDTNGVYALRVDYGLAFVAPSKAGVMFTPAMLELNVTTNLTVQDFVATAVCNEVIANPGFETNDWWTIPAAGYPAAYIAWPHSGARSMRTGIVNAWENQLTESRVRSPLFSIPAGVASATLRMWLYPTSSESAPAVLDDPAAQQDQGVLAPAFGDTTLLYDAQYVRVLDTNNNDIGTLLYIRSNNAFWSFHQFDLTPFAGRTIKIEVGAYNDGTDGVTALYVDDVSLAICSGGPTPPPPPPGGPCANQVANSGFEYNGSWNMPVTPYPAGYSADAQHSGARSMRTGIPLYSGSSVYSYSDAWQDVYIPTVATDVRLKLWLLPRSQEAGASIAEDETELRLAPEAPAAGTVWNDQALAPDAPDAQYVLLLNPVSGEIIRTLEWWAPRNASGWLYREYDLSAYAGRYVRLQVGTFNDGVGGRSVMYVDDVTVEICAAPPPPVVCSERLVNGGFENNSGWYIPTTAFSAGYSNWLWRSGARSMRTGIVNWYHNRYSYSDFRQTFTIPAGTRNATLTFSAFSMSDEAFADLALSERPTSGDLSAEAMAGDVQYLLVLDRYGYWIDTLVWRRSNERSWRNFSFNMNRFVGQTIILQWGTFNNGYDGVTSMYVDDVSLQACP